MDGVESLGGQRVPRVAPCLNSLALALSTLGWLGKARRKLHSALIQELEFIFQLLRCTIGAIHLLAVVHVVRRQGRRNLLWVNQWKDGVISWRGFDAPRLAYFTTCSHLELNGR